MAQRGETEDGLGWGGLVASKAELREERRQAQLEKDAERYRWLREQCDTQATLVQYRHNNAVYVYTCNSAEEMDRAVDQGRLLVLHNGLIPPHR